MSAYTGALIALVGFALYLIGWASQEPWWLTFGATAVGGYMAGYGVGVLSRSAK